MMGKRRAKVNWIIHALKKILLLPGTVVGVRMRPGSPQTVEFKIEGLDLPSVAEGAVIPEIDIEIVETHAFWTDQHGAKHLVRR